ncbi:ribosome silencing factor [uncultured Eubacterium sp.]|jgi:ribosome-associated protein|uniref:ribosome silencing factor n=1 Tax=uncultured Eubacterium sp. TaxID=165185 RepID=UPI00262BDED5|nr:ribosome silencing factor [uncultured Eubacterium sp.]
MESRELAKIAYNALDEKKGINISVIDISEISTLADYFIIAGGNNENQVKALANSVEEEMYKVDCKPKHIEGFDNANWILMDFSDIIVHVFNEEDRLFYDLERIWRDGKHLEVTDL